MYGTSTSKNSLFFVACACDKRGTLDNLDTCVSTLNSYLNASIRFKKDKEPGRSSNLEIPAASNSSNEKTTNVEEIQNTSYNIQQNQMAMTQMTLPMITVPTSQTYQSY